MTIFVFPDGTMMGLDQELCDEFGTEEDHEGVYTMVVEILYEWGFDGVPDWWKERYKRVIIENAIHEGHSLMTGIVCNQKFNEWYASPEVPYGHVEFR